MKLQNKQLIMVFLIIVTIAISACTTSTSTTPINNNNGVQSFSASTFTPNMDVEAKSFKSIAELEAFLESNQGSSNYYGGGMRSLGGEVMMDMAANEAMPAPTMALSKTVDGGSDDFSETNNQVTGVDEGDIIKTDGEFIYTISGKSLFIVKAYPAEDAELINEMSFEKGNPSGMFINGDDLVVFGYLNNYDILDDLSIPSRTSLTFVEVYDMSDKNDLSLEKEFLFEGNLFESRMIGDFVYIVTNSYPQSRPHPMPFLIEDNVLRETSIDSIKYFPIPYDSVSFVTINALDLNSLEHESETLAVESSREMYMSHNNMYLMYTKRINEWEISQEVTVDLIKPLLSNTDKALIKKIESADSDLLTRYEKEQKIMTLVYRYVEFLTSDEQDDLQEDIELAVKVELEKFDYFEYTIIHRVEVDGLDIDAKANGEVPGYVNNQFSLDEFDSVLRIATTVGARWSSFDKDRSESENFAFTLDEDLEILDSIDNIASGERIYSTRFMGEKLYMVTFRQVDPFFVIDLSNPKDIKSLGELKIPGFSRYLHPYDETHIIGLGRDASSTGRVQGLKISIFDVSDVMNPIEVAKWESVKKHSSSSAEYEHKAFLFSKDKNLLVIPAYNYEWNDGQQNEYNGALVFDIKADNIELRGLIDHSIATNNRWGAAVERSLYIDDMLYTKSFSLLRINALDDLKSVKDIELKATSVEDMPVY